MKIDLVEFAKYLNTLNRSKNTIEAYIRDLWELNGLELNDETIREFITKIKGKPSTKNRKLSALRMLLRFYNYNYGLPKIKQPDNRREYKIITKEEFEERIQTLEPSWQCVLRFLYYYALRVSEVGNIEINREKDIIIVKRKGGKIQVFPIIDAVKNCEPPKKISRQRIYQVVKRIFGVSPHHLRASRLTLIGEKEPMMAVVIAGHSNPQTTMRYIQPSLEDIRKALT